MKKLKLTKKGKKIIGVLAGIASLLTIILVFLILSLNTDISKTYNTEKLHSILIGEYDDLNLREMDQIDLLNRFGIIKDDIPESLALMSHLEDNEENKFKETIIIIINTENYQYYYDSLESQIDSITRYSENKEEVELYSNSILKADKNYVYLIVGKNAKEIENIINE